MDMMTLTIILVFGALALIILGVVTRREQVASPELEECLERFGTAHLHSSEEDQEREHPNLIADRVGKAVQNREVGRSMARLLSGAAFV